MYPITTPTPRHTITLDFVSKFAPALKTKHDQCLVMVDKFSKFVALRGCSSRVTAEDTAQMFLEKMFPLFEAPRVIISDRGCHQVRLTNLAPTRWPAFPFSFCCLLVGIGRLVVVPTTSPRRRRRFGNSVGSVWLSRRGLGVVETNGPLVATGALKALPML